MESYYEHAHWLDYGGAVRCQRHLVMEYVGAAPHNRDQVINGILAEVQLIVGPQIHLLVISPVPERVIGIDIL